MVCREVVMPSERTHRLFEARMKDVRRFQQKEVSGAVVGRRFKEAFQALGAVATALMSAKQQGLASEVDGLAGMLRRVQKQVGEGVAGTANLEESDDRIPSRMTSVNVQVPVAFQIFHDKASRVGKEKWGPDSHGFYAVEMQAPGVLLIGSPVIKKVKFKTTYTAAMARDGYILADTVWSWKGVDGLSPLEKALLRWAMRATFRWSTASVFFEDAEDLDEASSGASFSTAVKAAKNALKRARYYEGDLAKTSISIATALIENKPLMEYFWGLPSHKRSEAAIRDVIGRPIEEWLMGHDAEDDPEMAGLVDNVMMSIVVAAKSNASKLRKSVRFAGMREGDAHASSISEAGQPLVLKRTDATSWHDNETRWAVEARKMRKGTSFFVNDLYGKWKVGPLDNWKQVIEALEKKSRRKVTKVEGVTL